MLEKIDFNRTDRKISRIMDLYDRIHDDPFLWPVYITVDNNNITMCTDNLQIIITENYTYGILVYDTLYTYKHLDDAIAKLKEIAIETQNYIRKD